MTDKTGKCMCGAVKFTLRDVETEIGACHCEMCRRWSGTALMALTAPEDTITFEGTDDIQRFQSSDWAERAFCKKCGSGLWYRVTMEGPHGGTYQIPLGLLDDPNGITLKREIFIDCKPDGFAYVGPTKQMTRAQVMKLYGVSFDETNERPEA